MLSIVRYRPVFREYDAFNKSGTTKNISSIWSPQIDVVEESDKYRVIADLPGVKPRDIKISIENDILTIQGERKAEARNSKEGTTLERSEGAFYRQFTLPNDVNEENIEAKTKHGVLEVVLHKKEPVKPKVIDVKVKDEP